MANWWSSATQKKLLEALYEKAIRPTKYKSRKLPMRGVNEFVSDDSIDHLAKERELIDVFANEDPISIQKLKDQYNLDSESAKDLIRESIPETNELDDIFLDDQTIPYNRITKAKTYNVKDRDLSKFSNNPQLLRELLQRRLIANNLKANPQNIFDIRARNIKDSLRKESLLESELKNQAKYRRFKTSYDDDLDNYETLADKFLDDSKIDEPYDGTSFKPKKSKAEINNISDSNVLLSYLDTLIAAHKKDKKALAFVNKNKTKKLTKAKNIYKDIYNSRHKDDFARYIKNVKSIENHPTSIRKITD